MTKLLKGIAIIALGTALIFSLFGCGKKADDDTVADDGEPFATDVADKDFSKYKTPGSQETAYEYNMHFLPAADGIKQPYVGDTMPYYEDGVYYIYYLKDGGDSFNHSIYLATTRDFLTYEEQDEPVLESSRDGGQDAWIGTGSVVKVGDTYYFFYTGHAASDSFEYKEKIMLAKSSNLRSFEKVEGFEIIPDKSIGQKRDFRDPQAYYNADEKTITLTITAAVGGTARIVKYTLSEDLKNVVYDGIIFTDPYGKVFNLECTDTFSINGKYYITYSAQDDTLWYAMSDKPYGPYSEPVRMDGKLFYAAKHVESAEGYYMVGWTRKSQSPSSTSEVSGWGGNLTVHRIAQASDGSIYLAPVESISKAFDKRRPLVIKSSKIKLEAGSLLSYEEVFKSYESYKLTGTFKYTGKGQFGLAFDYSKDNKDYKLITLDPKKQTVSLGFKEGSVVITEKEIHIEQDKEYSFTFIQEGSVGAFYLDGQAVLTVRLYGITGKSIRIFAESNNVEFSDLREYTK